MTMPENDPLRRRVAAAYDDVLREPVPDRLTALLEPAKVVDLAQRRERRAAWKRPALTWAQLGGMAASVLVGIALGTQLPLQRDGGMLAESGGNVVAGARLATALDTRLASEAGDVRVQLSFVDRSGRFCRTFAAGQLAGLACRDGARWDVVTTAQVQPASGEGLRQAASAVPKPVLDAVDARIAGSALDAPQERAARDRGWRR